MKLKLYGALLPLVLAMTILCPFRADAAGAVRFDCDMTVDGVDVPAGTAVYAETWPTQFCCRAKVPAGRTFFRFESDPVDGVETCPTQFYPQMDGTFWVVPPAFDDTVRDFRGVLAARVLWVDAENGDDASGAGTESSPWKTLQYAVDQVGDSEPSLILAKPGDYDEGGDVLQNASNRVTIASQRKILIKSVGGAAVTFITGAADETTYPELQPYYPKMGPLAKRCVAVDQKSLGCCVQGFTLRDGHPSTVYGSDGNAVNPWGDSRTHGGAFYSFKSAVSNQLVDCVVTGCTAGKGLVSAAMLRTLVTKCHAPNSLHTDAWAVSSAFVDNTGDGRMGDYEYYLSYAKQNMLIGSYLLVSTIPYASMSGKAYWNGAYGTQYIPAMMASTGWGSVFVSAGQGDVGGGASYVKTTEQFFADPSRYDARIIRGSPAETDVVLPETGSAYYRSWATNFAALATTDINGKPLRFRADGAPLPGAYQRPVQALVFSTAKAAFDVSGSSGGVTCGEAGQTITLKPNDAGTEVAKGVVVGGVTNLFDALPGGVYSYTVPEGFTQGTVDVEVLLANARYVDAVNGDDTAKGISRRTAVKTLARGMKLCSSGYTLKVLPGVYDEGVMDRNESTTFDDKNYPLCRVKVKMGVTMESTDGPEKTVIVGAPASVGTPDEYGRGTNAVACIRVHSSTNPGWRIRIKGFTLTGGRTRGDDGTSRPYENERYTGAAIHAIYGGYGDTVVENCIITNNFAASSCYACYNVTLVGCTLGGNVPSNLSKSRMVNCLALDGGCSSVFGAEGCTFLENTSFGLEADPSGVCYPCINSLILGRLNWMIDALRFTNCVFWAEHGGMNYKSRTVDSLYTNKTAIAVDDGGCPAKDSVLVDRGWAVTRDSLSLGSMDARGGQRVYNGAPDIGAVEYDWRGDYAKDIAAAGALVVAAAGSSVVETDEGDVRLPPGGVLTGTWDPPMRASRTAVTVRVGGSGVLTVTADGETVATLQGPAERTVLAVRLSRVPCTLSFSYTGGDGFADIVKARELGGFRLIVR